MVNQAGEVPAESWLALQGEWGRHGLEREFGAQILGLGDWLGERGRRSG